MRSYLLKSATALFFGCSVLLSIFGFWALHGSSYTGLRLADKSNAALVTSVDAGSPAHNKVLPNDRLLAIDGRPIKAIAFNLDPSYVRSRKDLRVFWDEERTLEEAVVIGKPVRLYWERAGEQFEITLTPVPFPLLTALKRTLPLYFVAWTFLVVAWLVLRKKDHEIAVANVVIGFFVCITYSSLAPFAHRDLFLHVSAFRTLLEASILGCQGFSSAIIHLMLIFPRRKKILGGRPWLLAAPYVIYVTIASVDLAGVFDNTYFTTYVFMNACLIVFFGNLLYNFFVEKNIVYKRQIQWVVFGMTAGSTAWLALTSIPIVFGAGFVSEEVSVLPTIIYPVCFAFAVTKYRLMDIDRIFDAAVVYGLTIIILEGIELAVLGTMSKYISIAQKTPYLSLVGVLMIVFLYVPLRNRVKNGVERLFRRGKYDIEKETRRFTTSLGLRDGSFPLEKFSLFAEELLGPSGICIIKFRGEKASVYFSEGEKAEHAVGAIERAGAKIQAHFSGKTSCAFGYELSAAALGEAGPDIENSLFLFLSAGEESAYLVALLPKWNETGYSNKDRALLGAVSAQLANALDTEQRYVPAVKITAPKATSGIVLRERLFDRLDGRGAHSVIWVTGPAGSGKSTLASSYLESRKRASLWYNIDEGDGDIAAFFYYLGMAARRADAGTRKPLPLFTPEYLGSMPVFTKRYFEDLCSRLILPHSSRLAPHGFVIVFDNYQDAPVGSVFHEMIVHGLEAIPEGIQVIVLSRGEPPDPFARLIANRGISFIGWEDIRLTKDESREIVRMKGWESMPPDVSDRLYEMTGGWAAGLILTLERTKFKEADFRSPKGLAPGEVFTYFANEILEKMDKETQDFLLITSFLPEMTAEAAEKLTGAGTSWQTLYRLSKNHYFTERHSGEKTAYRYHPLFREFLLSRASEVFSQADISQIQRKVAALLGESGKVEDAVELLIKAADWNGAAGVITKHARPLLKQGRTRTILQWLAAVPNDVLERMPWLLYWSGVCRSPAGYLESRAFFEKAFHRFQEANDPAGTLLSWASIMDTIVYEFGELRRFDPWIDWLNEHMGKQPGFPSPEIEFKVTSSMLAALMFRRSRHEEIDPWAERALRLLPSCPDINLRIATSVYVALFCVWTGDLDKAGTMVNEQQQWCRSPESTPLSLIMGKYTEALYQWISAHPDFGVRAAEEGLEVSSANGIHMLDHHLFARKLFGALNSGDLSAAKDCFDKLESATEGSRTGHMVKYQYHYLPSWHSLLKGDYSLALQQARASMKAGDEAGGSAFHRAFSIITAAQALIETEGYAEAQELLSEIHRIADEIKSPIIEFTCLLSEAYLFFKGAAQAELPGTEDFPAKGPDCLRNAMTLGRQHRYMNTVVWYPHVVTYLCARALESGIEVEYVQSLIRKRNLSAGEGHLHLENWPWPVKIQTLGRFAILVDDRPVAFAAKAQRKPLELLKAIVSLGGSDVPESDLNDILWPESEGDAAHSAFTTTLSRLRQLLGNDKAVLIRDGKATLNPRLCWVDAWAFERMSEKIENLMRKRCEEKKQRKRTSPHDRVADSSMHHDIEKTISLYRGGYLASDGSLAWTLSPRERLRNKFLLLVSHAGEIHEHAGQWERAAAYYQKALETDELSEDIAQRLMTCQLKLDRSDEAISTYRRCKQKLLTSFGIAPSEKTEALYQSAFRR